ncbi:MAG: UTP--glucose-1-phosphate uridylyltransferase [Phycisphaerales bacterium JB039]
MDGGADLRSALERIEQEHLLHFWDELTAEQRSALRAQIEAIDLQALPGLIQRFVRSRPGEEELESLAPAPYYPVDPARPPRQWDAGAARAAGMRLLGEGKVGALTVAGGQGTRLGFDGPKGCFPGGAVSQKPLFAVFADAIAAAGRACGRPVPWAIMTSPLNDAETREFFGAQSYFGLDPEQVLFFQQGTMPSLEMGSGRMLLAEKWRIATNPDGHGGSIDALHRSGVLAKLRDRGVEHISYFQVDNPLVRAIDPVFLGLHATAADSSAEMSSKMLPKAYPEEKVGVFCKRGDRLVMVEYSDLPEELATERDERGRLRFIAGSPAIHILGAEFVHQIASDPEFALPLHRAEKKVPFVDLDTAERVEPPVANAVKLEKFVFDALPLARASIVLETDRTEEFAPIKNATGVDSVVSSREIQTERAARWLEARGVRVPRTPEGKPDCILELRPERLWPELSQPDPPARIEPGVAMVI